MDVVRGLENARLSIPSHVAVGVFDGVHRGHRHLIGAMTRAAHATGRLSTVVTFDPHPAALFDKGAFKMLTSIEAQAALIAELGVDLFVVLNFTAEVANTPAFDFAATMKRNLRMVDLWSGPDFALGRNREGTVDFLRQVGEQLGFSVHVQHPLTWRDEVISSTRIRLALVGGNLAEANGCLGRPYRLPGVVSGRNREGAYLFEPEPEQIVPARGFYACVVVMAYDERSPALVKINGEGGPLHVNVLDLKDELSRQRVALDFHLMLEEGATDLRVRF
jgi:riboflavin kinase/FMN adenylyltransferase